MSRRRCCCTSTPACPVTITVTSGCNSAPIADAPVEIRNGATVVGSGTTDASGVVTIGIPAAGGYTIAIGKSGYVPVAGFRTLACGGSAAIAMYPNIWWIAVGDLCGALFPGRAYSWTGPTSGGGVLEGGELAAITVNGPGTYTLSLAAYDACHPAGSQVYTLASGAIPSLCNKPAAGGNLGWGPLADPGCECP